MGRKRVGHRVNTFSWLSPTHCCVVVVYIYYVRWVCVLDYNLKVNIYLIQWKLYPFKYITSCVQRISCVLVHPPNTHGLLFPRKYAREKNIKLNFVFILASSRRKSKTIKLYAVAVHILLTSLIKQEKSLNLNLLFFVLSIISKQQQQLRLMRRRIELTKVVNWPCLFYIHLWKLCVLWENYTSMYYIESEISKVKINNHANCIMLTMAQSNFSVRVVTSTSSSSSAMQF